MKPSILRPQPSAGGAAASMAPGGRCGPSVSWLGGRATRDHESYFISRCDDQQRIHPIQPCHARQTSGHALHGKLLAFGQGFTPTFEQHGQGRGVEHRQPMGIHHHRAVAVHPQPLLEHVQAGSSLAVGEFGGSTSMARGLSALGSARIGLVARGQCLDQAVDALGIDLLRELAPVGFHQPDTQHIQVVDLPACAITRSLFEAVVELDGVARPTISVRTSTSLSSAAARRGLTWMLWSLTWASAPA